MEISRYIRSSDFRCFGVTGGAGSGKSTLARSLAKEQCITLMHLDNYFIGDSAYRKGLLSTKRTKSNEEYLDGCNQFNWWDWDAILSDLTSLREGNPITLRNAYNRDTGKWEGSLTLSPSKYTILEGALLGTLPILSLLDRIFMVTTPSFVRLERLIAKDKDRRTALELCERFVLTERSEQLHYDTIRQWFGTKIIAINDQGSFIK